MARTLAAPCGRSAASARHVLAAAREDLAPGVGEPGIRLEDLLAFPERAVALRQQLLDVGELGREEAAGFAGVRERPVHPRADERGVEDAVERARVGTER